MRTAGGGLTEVTAAALAGAAAAIAGALSGDLAGDLVPSVRREIFVLSGSPEEPLLEEPILRALLSWATVAGAALLIEPDPGCLVGTAVWARPTVFAGTAADLAGLRVAAERQERGRLRRLFRKRPGLPFGRLQTVLAIDPGPLPPAEDAFWRGRGVRVRFLPQCGIAGI